MYKTKIEDISKSEVEILIIGCGSGKRWEVRGQTGACEIIMVIQSNNPTVQQKHLGFHQCHHEDNSSRIPFVLTATTEIGGK